MLMADFEWGALSTRLSSASSTDDTYLSKINIFQQIGAPTEYTFQVRALLDTLLPALCIGRCSDIGSLLTRAHSFRPLHVTICKKKQGLSNSYFVI